MNSTKQKRHGMGVKQRTCNHHRRRLRQQEAETRNGAWSLLTPFQKLEYLNKNHLSAPRQRERLAKEIKAFG